MTDRHTDENESPFWIAALKEIRDERYEKNWSATLKENRAARRDRHQYIRELPFFIRNEPPRESSDEKGSFWADFFLIALAILAIAVGVNVVAYFS